MVNSIHQPQATFTLGRACLLSASAVWLLLGAGGCGSPNHGDLFGAGPALTSGGSSAGTASGGAGSAGMSANTGGGAENVAGSLASAGSGGSGAGCAFSCGDGGRSQAGSSGEAGDVSAQAGSAPQLPVCTALGADAADMPAAQHCYVVDIELRTFADAQAHCESLGAHLLTLSSEAENDFAWSLLAEVHWIGAKDGKAPKQSGAGTYSWITGEPFEYSNWSSNQPNASETSCSEGSGSCYEHCAFQWTGGEHDGQWNDRYCMHTIASICEWDSAR